MIKYGNIELITTITLLTLYHLYLLLLVRLGGYKMNWSDFYSYRLIGKLTGFFTTSGVQLAQSDRGQFHFHRAPFTQQLKIRVVLKMVHLSYLNHTLTHHTLNLSSINLVSIFRCSSSPINPVYPRHVTSNFNSYVQEHIYWSDSNVSCKANFDFFVTSPMRGNIHQQEYFIFKN